MKDQLITNSNGTVTFRCKKFIINKFTKECNRTYCIAFDQKVVKGKISCKQYKSKSKTRIRLLTLEWIDYINYKANIK